MIVELDGTESASTVKEGLHRLGLWPKAMSVDGEVTHFVVSGASMAVSLNAVNALPGVSRVASRTSPHPLVDKHGPVLRVGDVCIGGKEAVLLAGPCSVESEAQIFHSAKAVNKAGGKVLRGGAFKPRSSPYAFQGHGEEGLKWLRAAAKAHNLLSVTETTSPDNVELVAEYADILQIGARNMQNYPLLVAAGRVGKPVMLKRGLTATIEEWLLAAEYLLHAGASGVALCERGVRTFSNSTRFTLDISAIALIRDVYGLPVIADPSHACGRRDLIQRLALASLVAGAAGVIVETHPEPGVACSDAPQQLTHGELFALGGAMGVAPCLKGNAA